MTTATETTSSHSATVSDHGIPVEIDEFWTSRQRQGHSLHEISYRACFKSQLPEYFINRYTRPGDNVLDPFMGRGTTPLQAHLMGRIAFGSDANPLCVMLARPRFNPPLLTDIESRLAEMPTSAPIPDADAPLLTFYHESVLQQLIAYKQWFAQRTADGTFDNIDDWIRMVCINRLSGHSTGFFSVRTMPPNQAVSIERQRIINARNNQTPEPKDIPAIILRKTRSLLRSGYPAESIAQHLSASYNIAQSDGAATIGNGHDPRRLSAGSSVNLHAETAHDSRVPATTNRSDKVAIAGLAAQAQVVKPSANIVPEPNLAVCQSHQLDYVPDDSIDLVVTSPPFLDIVDYKGDNWLRCWFAGIDTAAVHIDSHTTPTAWRTWLHDTFAELSRVLRPGGKIAFEVGEVRNATLNLEEEVIQATTDLPLTPDLLLINQQTFTKTSNIWGVDNNSRGTNTNRVVVLGRG